MGTRSGVDFLPSRPSETVSPDQTANRLEALHIAKSMPDTHSTDDLIKNAKAIIDWVSGAPS